MPGVNFDVGGTNTQAYSSFSGIDLIAVVGDVVIATLQGISYSITREKAEAYFKVLGLSETP